MRVPLLMAVVYGAIIAALFIGRLANYAGIIAVVAAGHFLIWIIDRARIAWYEDRPVLSLRTALPYFAVVMVFLGCSAVGVGCLWYSILNKIANIDRHFAALEASVRNRTFDHPGITYERMNAKGTFPISPCEDGDVIVFYNDAEFIIVIPLTRPDLMVSLMSMSHFNAIIWNEREGWTKDKVHWWTEFPVPKG